jgi:hypothetical protein
MNSDADAWVRGADRKEALERASRPFKAAIAENPLLSVTDKEVLSKDSFFLRYSFYYSIVESFRDQFPTVDEGRWSQAAQGCFFSFLFVRGLDDLIDKAPSDETLSLQRRVLAFHAQAQLCFKDVFPGNATFWPMLSQVYDRHFQAMSDEGQIHRRAEKWHLEAYLQHAADKACMVAVIPTVLRNLSESSFPHGEVETSLLQYHIALQIIDDLDDLVEDIASQKPTYYSQMLLEFLAQHEIKIDPSSEGDLLKRYLYVSGVANSGYREVIGCLTNAMTALPPLISPQYVGFLQTQIVAFQQRINVVDSRIEVAREKALQQRLGGTVASS